MAKIKGIKVIFSCEHASNFVPDFVRNHVKISNDELDLHISYDIAANNLMQYCKSLADFSISGTLNRLCCDLNRSITNPKISKRVRDKDLLQKLINDFYLPYHQTLNRVIASEIKKFAVLHISFHSFTDKLNGKVRDTDIGILYDNKRKTEFKRSLELLDLCKAQGYRSKRNYPYRGYTDGICSNLRHQWSEKEYCGFEFEINQKLSKNDAFSDTFKQDIFLILKNFIEDFRKDCS